jgi:hypothetical protein
MGGYHHDLLRAFIHLSQEWRLVMIRIGLPGPAHMVQGADDRGTVVAPLMNLSLRFILIPVFSA